MAQRTILVSNRLDNGEEVVASGRTHRDAIAAALEERVETWTAAQAAAAIDVFVGHLHAHNELLGATEDEYVAEQADDPTVREAREEAKANLLDLAVRARSRIADTLGRAGLERYGLESDTPRNARALASHVENAIKLLRGDVAEIDDGLGGTLATTALADSLAAAHAPLADAVARLRVESREGEGALTARDRALEEWTDAYQGVATVLVGLYRLAGRQDLAERIRPTDRRASGRETSEPSPGDPTPVEPPVVEDPVGPDEPGPSEPS